MLVYVSRGDLPLTTKIPLIDSVKVIFSFWVPILMKCDNCIPMYIIIGWTVPHCTFSNIHVVLTIHPYSFISISCIVMVMNFFTKVTVEWTYLHTQRLWVVVIYEAFNAIRLIAFSAYFSGNNCTNIMLWVYCIEVVMTFRIPITIERNQFPRSSPMIKSAVLCLNKKKVQNTFSQSQKINMYRLN